ncbi:MAG: molybdopterin adenylyltransferase [Anaerolineae bacterium]|nr:molybdopterin adenylyltransferase [Anaerolineae bacterium]
MHGLPRPSRIGIVTVSDRASRGEYADLGGPTVREYLNDHLQEGWEALTEIIPDEQRLIESTLMELADVLHCSLIITTGGTGPAPRDITPEATVAVCQKILPGFGEAMRAVSLLKVPTALLSRQTAGIRGSTLIVNLPGSPKAIRECLDVVMPAIPHCIALIGGAEIHLRQSHSAHQPHGN